MSWKIESRQKSVAGIGGHNYLALVDPTGAVRGEIHGAQGENQRLVYADSLPEPGVHGAARPIAQGTESDIKKTWDTLHQNAKGLHGKAVYGVLSPNSNAFWATVLRMSGFDYKNLKPNSQQLTPGTGVDLTNPLWWTPEHRWPGVAAPDTSDPPHATSAYRLP